MKKKGNKKGTREKKAKALVVCGACHRTTEFNGPNCRKCGLPLELVGFERP